MKQLTLWDDEELEALRPQPKRPKRNGGSSNPIVFRDYESFIAKFTDNPKTTDECWTPKDIYEAVVDYVGTVIDLTDKVVLRPFYPGGNYQEAEYPENGVVIDNPPFSIFAQICKWYTARKVPFFLFGPGMTIGNVTRYCTAVIVGSNIKFTNGASVRINFASNLFGDMVIMTAPKLCEALENCESQDQKVNLPSYAYPDEVLSVSDMQTIAGGGVDFRVRRSECAVVRELAHHPGDGGLFGEHWLIAKAIAKAKAKAKAKAVIHIHLSKSEKRITEHLDTIEDYDT